MPLHSSDKHSSIQPPLTASDKKDLTIITGSLVKLASALKRIGINNSDLNYSITALQTEISKRVLTQIKIALQHPNPLIARLSTIMFFKTLSDPTNSSLPEGAVSMHTFYSADPKAPLWHDHIPNQATYYELTIYSFNLPGLNLPLNIPYATKISQKEQTKHPYFGAAPNEDIAELTSKLSSVSANSLMFTQLAALPDGISYGHNLIHLLENNIPILSSQRSLDLLEWQISELMQEAPGFAVYIFKTLIQKFPRTLSTEQLDCRQLIEPIEASTQNPTWIEAHIYFGTLIGEAHAEKTITLIKTVAYNSQGEAEGYFQYYNMHSLPLTALQTISSPVLNDMDEGPAKTIISTLITKTSLPVVKPPEDENLTTVEEGEDKDQSNKTNTEIKNEDKSTAKREGKEEKDEDPIQTHLEEVFNTLTSAINHQIFFELCTSELKSGTNLFSSDKLCTLIQLTIKQVLHVMKEYIFPLVDFLEQLSLHSDNVSSDVFSYSHKYLDSGHNAILAPSISLCRTNEDRNKPNVIARGKYTFTGSLISPTKSFGLAAIYEQDSTGQVDWINVQTLPLNPRTTFHLPR